MTTRKTDHWTAVEIGNRLLAIGVFIAGLVVLRWGHDEIGAGMIGFGIFGMLPSSRKLMSRLVDILPGLPKKTS